MGVLDSFVDIVGGIICCELLDVSRVTASPVNVGTGTLRSAHGVLPAPGPAVAVLATRVPIYSAGPSRELTTPTGLALLRTLTSEFGPMELSSTVRAETLTLEQFRELTSRLAHRPAC